MTFRRMGVVALVLLAPVWVGCTSILGDFSDGPLDDGAVGAGDSGLRDSGHADGHVVGAHDAHVAVDARQDSHVSLDAGHDGGAPADAQDGGPPTETGTGDAAVDCGTETNCSGVCVDTTSSAAHCGTTCQACPAAETCVSSACTCAAPAMMCASTTCNDLTSDPANCGACMHDCQGGACSNGVCQPVVLVPAAMTVDITDIASDGHSVFWADLGSNTIDQVSTPGGAKTVLANSTAGDVDGPYELSASLTGNGDVTWLQPNSAGNGFLFGDAISGMAGSGVLEGNVLGSGEGIAFDPSGLTFYTQTVSGGVVTIKQCTLATGACTVVTSDTATTSGLSIVHAGQFIVWASGNEIDEFNNIGGGEANIAGQDSVDWIAADTQYVYWVTESGSILSAAIGTTFLTSPIATNAANDRFSSDGTNLYFVTNAGDLVATNVGGGSAQVVLVARTIGISAPAMPTYAGGAVYYVATNTGDSIPSIWRVATP
jgi:hypothetical protein